MWPLEQSGRRTHSELVEAPEGEVQELGEADNLIETIHKVGYRFTLNA